MRNLTPLVLLAGVLVAGCSRQPGGARAETGNAAGTGVQNPAAPVARVNGQVITAGELAAEARGALAAADARYAEEVYGVNAHALDELIGRRLLAARAQRDHLTVEALLQRDVVSKVPEPDEATLRSVYDQTKATGRPVPPFESSRADIARFVKGESARTLQQQYVAALRAEARVESLLPPLLLPKVEVKADGPSRGDAAAPVTVVEFTDYECPFCAGVEGTLKRVREAYPGKVRFVVRSYPLSGHANAPKAAEAALCAGEQGRYWEMHDRLFANQQALSPADLSLIHI